MTPKELNDVLQQAMAPVRPLDAMARDLLETAAAALRSYEYGHCEHVLAREVIAEIERFLVRSRIYDLDRRAAAPDAVNAGVVNDDAAAVLAPEGRPAGPPE